MYIVSLGRTFLEAGHKNKCVIIKYETPCTKKSSFLITRTRFMNQNGDKESS